MKLRKSSIGVLVSIVAAAVLLSGCTALLAGRPVATSAPSGSAGISREEAAELVNAVPGLRDASVGEYLSGISAHAIIEIYVVYMGGPEFLGAWPGEIPEPPAP